MDIANRYLEKINAVIDYIEAHLDEPLRLPQLAAVAGFSPYHFHRIFHAFTGESLYHYITRLRLERAAAKLLTQQHSITETALACGFTDSATFARAFKKAFHMTASQWRDNSKNHQANRSLPAYTQHQLSEQPYRPTVMPIHIEITRLPQTRLAYIRHTGAFAGDSEVFLEPYQRLLDWASPQGIVQYPATKNLVVYHDPIEITAEEKLKISIGITVPESVTVGGHIGALYIAPGRYLCCRYQLCNDQYGVAWQQVYRQILPERELQPTDQYCFESYPEHCFDEESQLTEVDICVPVENL